MLGEGSAVSADKLHLPVLLFREKCTMPSPFQFFHMEKLLLAHREQMIVPRVLGLEWDHSTAEE